MIHREDGNHDVHRETTRTANTFRALDAGDRSADPRPEFLAQLKERLELNARSSTIPLSNALQSRDPQAFLPIEVDSPAIWEPKRRFLGGSHVNWLATAGLLLLVGLFTVLAFRGGDNQRDEHPGFASSPESVASLNDQVVDIAECTTKARPSGTVRGFIGQTPSREAILPDYRQTRADTPGPVIDAYRLMADKSKADSTTIDGISGTVRQATACRFYDNPTPYGEDKRSDYIGPDGRFGALYSDDFYRRNAMPTNALAIPDAWVSQWWRPLGPRPWSVEEARMLPDGRAVAVIRTEDNYGYPIAWAAVFTETDDRWLIDEIEVVEYGCCHHENQQGLDIGLSDTLDGTPALVNGFPSFSEFYPDRPLTVTVANLGTEVQEVRIDALGLSGKVEPGHSISFAFHEAPGQYVLTSFVENTSTGEFNLRRLGWVLHVVGQGTPVAMG